MARVIAISNQKGGVAKTTTCCNLGAGLARVVSDGKRVLVVDLDPQANLTSFWLGIGEAQGPRENPTIGEVLLDGVPPQEAVKTIQLEGVSIQWNGEAIQVPSAEVDILPAHISLAPSELRLVSTFERERCLKKAFDTLQHDYEYILVDCPPSLGLLTLNALMAAGEVLIPVDPGYFPLNGLLVLMQTIDMVQGSNPDLRVLGILPTRMNHTVLARDTEQSLRKQYGTLTLGSIPDRVAVGEALANHKDIFAYAEGNDATRAYARLVREVMGRG